MKRRGWYIMRWNMSFQCWWVIVDDCCEFQQSVGRCSGSKQSQYTWTTPSSHWCAIFSHLQLFPRCHMFSSTSLCNLAPFSVNIQVLSINYSWNGIITAYLLPVNFFLRRLSVNIIWSVPPFLNHCHCKTPNLSQINDLPKSTRTWIQNQCPPWFPILINKPQE